MTAITGATQRTTRVIYPELPDPLTPDDVRRLFTPSFDERSWAPTIARTLTSQVALLVQLKVFQTIGRFLRASDIPAIVYVHVAQHVGLYDETAIVHPDRTLYRHRPAVLKHLGVRPWGAAARELALSVMIRTAKTRTDPADIINAAVDALIRHRFELPALIALRRLAGTAHSQINEAQWAAVCGRLDEFQRLALEALLVVDPKTQKSPFADLCRAPGRASRKNLAALIDRHRWLQDLPDPTAALQSIADSKVLQWANEARRLNALELREYVTPRRHTLLLAVIRQARGQVLDDLTQMLLRLVRKIEWKSEQRLEEWYVRRHDRTDSLIRAFHDSLIIHSSEDDATQKVARLEALFAARGGRDALAQSCAEHLRHERQNWRPFARDAFVPLRAPLLRVADILPLQATASTSDLLSLVSAVASREPPYYDYTRIDDFGAEVLPREWRGLVLDDPVDCKAFNRRQLEVVALLELAAAIKAGEMFVNGSLSYDRFWDRLPPEAADPAAISDYADDRGWQGGADGLVKSVKEALERQAGFLDRGVGDDNMAFIRRARDGRPIVTTTHAVITPASAIDLEKQLMELMPERSVLAAIANTENWTHWGRHFGPPSRLGPQIKGARHRYVLTTFAYGCGLGLTEAARHFSGTVSADQLAFVDRRHVDIANLRAASADLINLYSRFELPAQWGSGDAAAAGWNPLRDIRRQPASRAPYPLWQDRRNRLPPHRGQLHRTVQSFHRLRHLRGHIHSRRVTSEPLRPARRVHADTHGQSAAVFGLAYLLGIELMPRIRRWRKLRLYRAEPNCGYRYIASMFSGTVNWALIREQYPQLMQLALAIQGGAIAPSAVLARINSYSTRNRFALALQELGKAVRTTYLLEWIMNDSLRRTVHKGTTKIERHHKFAKHLAFGDGGLLQSNDPADQEKAIVYNELVANAVALQNVVDQTRALHSLKSEGTSIRLADLAFLSPYATSKLKRFGDYPTHVEPEPMPTTMTLPF